MFFKPSAATAEMHAATKASAKPEEIDCDLDLGTGFAGFESFGRSGLDLGGLHRDDQWVGSWGGRC